MEKISELTLLPKKLIATHFIDCDFRWISAITSVNSQTASGID